MEFNITDISSANTGLSSLREHYERTLDDKVKVNTIRMDEWMRNNNIDKIGFCKIDAEGCTYEVLEGFGEFLSKVTVIQLEAEHVEKYVGEKTYQAIEHILTDNGFELMLFERKGSQSDSLWVAKEYLINF